MASFLVNQFRFAGIQLFWICCHDYGPRCANKDEVIKIITNFSFERILICFFICRYGAQMVMSLMVLFIASPFSVYVMYVLRDLWGPMLLLFALRVLYPQFHAPYLMQNEILMQVVCV